MSSYPTICGYGGDSRSTRVTCLLEFDIVPLSTTTLLVFRRVIEHWHEAYVLCLEVTSWKFFQVEGLNPWLRAHTVHNQVPATLLIGKPNMYWTLFWQEHQNQTRRHPQEEMMLPIWRTQLFPCLPCLQRWIPLAPSAAFRIHLWASQRKRRRQGKRRVPRIA